MPWLIAPPGSGETVCVRGLPHEVFRGRIFTLDHDAVGDLLAHGYKIDASEPDEAPPEVSHEPDLESSVAPAPPEMDEIEEMDAVGLRAELKRFGENPGPRTSEDRMRARLRELMAG